ncbi:uncharacterized protein LOC133822077 [Humulus lupulus]|uniref:uncharacterized protein LOC133822077 n=1 Tax=Humulus lupulus TaxID=3486 RepID=UPI002B40EE88|nr:uncharacterized protein LOC133822077 [Humulus lupulus]
MECRTMKVFDILKETLTIFYKNINFVFFTILTSLPLFCFLIYYETFLQKFLFQCIENLPLLERTSYIPLYYDPYYGQYYDPWSLPVDIVRNLNKYHFNELIQMGFLYLVPLHLLELFSLLVTVDLSSKIYREDKALTFMDMLHLRIDKARTGATVITFLYVVFLSTCTLLAFIWLLITYSAVLMIPTPESEIVLYNSVGMSSLGFDLFDHLLYGSNLFLQVIIYLPWCAIWNLGLVISILEGTCGLKALGSAVYLSLKSLVNGVSLVIIFTIWELGLRALCLYFGSYKTWLGIVGQISLLCLGNALKWVSFVVYFQDCVRRVSRKKTDQEQNVDMRESKAMFV